jgi:LacI family transcriptional regulator
MQVLLRDVAARAGVSLATASRVLSGSRAGVSARSREAVAAAARELDYVPNAHAQALARAGSAHVGAILHDVSDPYFSEIVRGLQRAAAESQRLVTICNSYRDPERELAYVTLLRSQHVGALILTGSGLDDRAYSERLAAQIRAFAQGGGRTVFVGRHHVAGDAILPDNVGGARALARAMAELGHRRFAVISGPTLLTTTRDRIDGLRAGLADAGIRLDDAAIFAGDFSREGGYAAIDPLLAHGGGATCIIALNDTMAIGALAALRERGVRVPDDISVAGFDDIPIARDIVPALTTVHFPLAEMGARALRLALEPAGDELRVEHVAVRVIVRESTRPPASVAV